MGAVNTTYTFTATDTITSSKMNNIIDQTTMTADAVFTDGTIEVSSGKLRVAARKITSNELAVDSVTSTAIANNAVTQAKTNNMLVPTGAVMAFAMDSTPDGWRVANGAAISRTTYAALFAAIGTTYGSGDGSTTFNVPDLRGYFIRGHGTNSDGTESGEFGAKQADALQNITGKIDLNAQAGFNVTMTGAFYSSEGNTSTLVAFGSGAVEGDYSFDASRVARTSTETRPSNIAMRYCIKT